MSGNECIEAIMKLMKTYNSVNMLQSVKLELLKEHDGVVNDEEWDEINREENALVELIAETYKKEIKDKCDVNWEKVNSGFSVGYVVTMDEIHKQYKKDKKEGVIQDVKISDFEGYMDWLKKQGLTR